MRMIWPKRVGWEKITDRRIQMTVAAAVTAVDSDIAYPYDQIKEYLKSYVFHFYGKIFISI